MEDWRHTQDPAEGDQSRGEIGRLLEHKRKERGLSLEEVEQATKIRKRYLTGLEREDYAVLPDAVYARGFLKTYANYLGLDGEALSQRLKNSTKPQRERGSDSDPTPESDFEKPLISPSGLRAADKRKVSSSAVATVMVAVLALAAVIGALYFVGRGVQTTKENDPAPGETPPRQEQQNVAGTEKDPKDAVESKGTSEEKPVVAKQDAPPDTLRVVVDVRERPSWILIRTDGNRAYKQVAQPGFSETFEAEHRLFIKSGDAGAVWVEINGQDAGALGDSGEIVARRYTLKSAS
ncbi:MAG TPA: RodZ domain-containing protein [Rubrobacter sp.]|jgi:cytoskeleton protein RodZ|nr:RodZ domain-containing protein [Rubrobacter sp.]